MIDAVADREEVDRGRIEERVVRSTVACLCPASGRAG